MIAPRIVFRSAAFYPVTAFYLVGIAVVYLVATGMATVLYGILVLSVAAVFVLVVAAYRELKAVHKLVNSQRTELIERIDELVALLVNSGVAVPPSGEKEQEAREGAIQGRIEQ